MVVTSKINDNKFFYIKIPKTGTVAYTKLFFPEMGDNVLHVHDLYTEEYNNMPAFSVIRNPYERFISILYFMKFQRDSQFSNKKDEVLYRFDFNSKKRTPIPKNEERSFGFNFINIFQSEDFFYDFCYSTFYKNCKTKQISDLQSIFDAEAYGFVSSLFMTQVEWAYKPKVKLFRYENLSEFNAWIETTLGYNTNLLKKNNVTPKEDIKINIDFKSKKFKELVAYLFYDDFRYFNYSFPI